MKNGATRLSARSACLLWLKRSQAPFAVSPRVFPTRNPILDTPPNWTMHDSAMYDWCAKAAAQVCIVCRTPSETSWCIGAVSQMRLPSTHVSRLRLMLLQRTVVLGHFEE